MLPTVFFSWWSQIESMISTGIAWDSIYLFESHLQSGSVTLCMYQNNLACIFIQCTSLAPTVSSGSISLAFLNLALIAFIWYSLVFLLGESEPYPSSQCHLWYFQSSVRLFSCSDHLPPGLLSPTLLSGESTAPHLYFCWEEFMSSWPCFDKGNYYWSLRPFWPYSEWLSTAPFHRWLFTLSALLSFHFVNQFALLKVSWLLLSKHKDNGKL